MAGESLVQNTKLNLQYRNALVFSNMLTIGVTTEKVDGYSVFFR